MENYLLSLGKKERHDASAFTISVSNAARIFNTTTPMDFINMLSDVAVCIEDSLKSVPGLVAYAGNGNFVVVTTGHEQVDIELIENTVNIGLEGFAGIYQSDSIPNPIVKVGKQVRKSLFSRTSPTQLLDSAIAAIQHDAVTHRLPKLG